MEAAQLSPHDGERPCDPGSLEAGDPEPIGGNEATCHGNGGTQGDEGARDSWIWNDETPGAQDAEGARNPRACIDEGSGTSISEGPQDSGARTGKGYGDPGARRIEGPRARVDETIRASGSYSTGTDATSGEGPDARTDEDAFTPRSSKRPETISSEGPRTDETSLALRSTEGPNTISSEGPRTDETSLAPRFSTGTGTVSSEGPRTDETSLAPRFSTGTGTVSSEGLRTDETSLAPRSTEGPNTISSEGPRSDETSFAPRFSTGTGTVSSEGLRTEETILTARVSTGIGTSSSEEPQTDKTSFPQRSSKGASATTNKGTGNPGAITSSNEEPGDSRDGAHAISNDARAYSPDQRLTGSSRPKGTYAARTCNARPHDVSSPESWDAGAKDPPKQPLAESNNGENGSRVDTLESSTEGAGSFKKPIAPIRSSWNEKALDQLDKPSSSTIHSISRETAPDLSARLPSDAYQSSPAIPYREPTWSGWPEAVYSLEVLKGGSILSTKSLNGSSWTVFGRLPTCHVSLEHPSVSRYHAVLQYRSVPGMEPDQGRGFYVFDLGSTHGTFINKQRIQPKTYCRIRVGHVLKFGGSTRLFILQGPDEDQEAESELTVTEIKEARRQKESLQKRMLGDDSDEEDNPEEEGEVKGRKERGGADEAGCTWGMGEDAVEEENDVNPIAMEYQAEREALYSGNPKKALQGFFDREGEELDFEYEGRGIGSWLCSVKLPVDDSSGKQLVAEVVHSGKKKDAMRLCALEACRMLDMRGLLRQEAVSRKRKSKEWEAEDFYDSDDDTFLDRTGVVEKKRLNRMKKAGKIDEKPETYESLISKLDLVEKEMEEIATKLKTNRQDEAQTSTQDSLDAFMTEIKSGSSFDSVTRKKLHIQSLELKKEQQRLKSLIKIVQPTRLPELKPGLASQDPKTKKLTLPMFGAMKGGSKFKLKTGTVGRLPPKRTDLPSSLFTMKGDDNEPEEEDEDDNMETASRTENRPVPSETMERIPENRHHPAQGNEAPDMEEKIQSEEPKKKSEAPSASVRAPKGHNRPGAKTEDGEEETAAPEASAVRQKKVLGPSRPPPGALSSKYPEDDPDYCVWTPPTGQTGDGRTHLNEKYGY
ncbi:kanadaptin [Ranitomeya imitator]|uniref:kanadaptin n=1 Tax=Ranitomeya imitator TaxID=111125 RepID=UPI0037E7F0A5